jgi:hypothetical protein
MDNLSGHSFMNHDQRDAILNSYYHPILEKFGEIGREMGHGGMDYIMDARLVYCLQNGLPLDMDVYDMAEWCCLAELGTLSMDNNSAAVAFPDFTRGHWMDVDGYRHAYAENEAETEALALGYTQAQKSATERYNLWALYDALKVARDSGDAKAIAKASKRLDIAKQSAREAIDDEVKNSFK